MKTQDKNKLKRIIERSDITAYLNLIKLHDEETYNHCMEVGALTFHFFQKVKETYTAFECNEIVKGALLHDIGKIYLPFGLIQSTKMLDSYERKIIEEHPLIGYVSVKDTELSNIVKTIILKHHCQLNNKGYPIGEEIKEDEQYVWTVNMMDKFNAMTSIRPFKDPMNYEDAFSNIVNMAKSEVLPYQNLSIFKEVIKENQL